MIFLRAVAFVDYRRARRKIVGDFRLSRDFFCFHRAIVEAIRVPSKLTDDAIVSYFDDERLGHFQETRTTTWKPFFCNSNEEVKLPFDNESCGRTAIVHSTW